MCSVEIRRDDVMERQITKQWPLPILISVVISIKTLETGVFLKCVFGDIISSARPPSSSNNLIAVTPGYLPPMTISKAPSLWSLSPRTANKLIFKSINTIARRSRVQIRRGYLPICPVSNDIMTIYNNFSSPPADLQIPNGIRIINRKSFVVALESHFTIDGLDLCAYFTIENPKIKLRSFPPTINSVACVVLSNFIICMSEIVVAKI